MSSTPGGLRALLDAEILPRVEKPSRYLGTEVNSVHKDPRRVAVRLALCFPDLYDLGLGNLGLHILYAILNRREDTWAERVYAPGRDLEKALRARGLPLFGWESKDPLTAFDGIGFTLQSELTFTNILNVLDLGGIPLRTAQRREADPLTFAGGPAVFNPEPLAPFMDFFVMGDGEEIVTEIADLLRDVRGREARLDRLAELPGIYVPARTPVEVAANGVILPRPPGGRVVKRTTKALRAEDFPVNYVVPWTEQAHDRVALEVLRGCTQGCRFCQAGMTTRPVRERAVDDVGRLMERALDATGYEEVSLVSLSTCDHSHVRSLVAKAAEVAAPRRTSIGLPSLRLDSFSVELADMVADTRRTGLTFAPEAASPRLRAVINKWIPDEDLLEMSAQAYERGWDHVKLYFMIGLPTERDDDIVAIADLCRRVVERGRRIHRRASVRTGVSTFVPKPLTPFQWAPQIDMAETERRQRLLMDHLRHAPQVKFGRHHPEETWLEGLVSRSDRRAADLIEAAFRNGARFDAWSEHLDLGAWQRALAETGFDAVDALRERALDEVLPWDFVDIHIPKDWFVADWNRATELRHAPDCRNHKCHKCGVIDVLRPLCASMLRTSIEGAKAEKTWERPPVPPPPTNLPVQRLRFRYGRSGSARLLGHLEMAKAWQRTLRRAKAPLAYVHDFHPLPRVNFSSALPVGEDSRGEYMDVWLTERVEPAVLLAALRHAAPPECELLGVTEVPVHAPGLMGEVAGWDYTVFVPAAVAPPAELEAAVEALLARPEILQERDSKKGLITLDIRPMLRGLVASPALGGTELRLGLQVVEGRPGKIKEILALLGLDPLAVHIRREDSLVRDGEGFRSPGEGMVVGA